MARRPLPTAIKVLRGTARKHRLFENEIQPDVCIPDAPPVLTGIARAEWDRVSQILFDLGVLTKLDVAVLVCYCEEYGRLVDAESQLAGASLLIKNAAGAVVPNPLIAIANKAAELCVRFASELGLSPVSRSRVSARKPEKSKSEWEKFGKKKNT
jgi:P27 family predicted phage terminase small subunit